MASRDIVVIGASAGGIEALRRLCASLPTDFPGSVFVAQHLSASSRSVLAQLLDRAGPLPALTPRDEEPILPGHIYVAAPDHHLLLRPGRILMRRGPMENRSRPSVNALFRSAAVAYGGRVVGVVLTGLLDDGTEGLIAITAAGGATVVQDPDDAEWPSMPRNAIARDHVEHIVPLAQLGALLTRLVGEEARPDKPLSEDIRIEDRMAAQEIAVTDDSLKTPGTPSHIACPDCGGVLNQTKKDGFHFRCQIGHAFTPLGLASAQTDELERALAVAARTHRDRIRLFEQMREDAHARGLSHAEMRWSAAAEDSIRMAGAIEGALASLRRPVVDAAE